MIDYIDRLQRQLIVHSYIYYELNSNIWADSLYDSKMREMEEIIQKHPKDFLLSTFHNIFKDFSPSSGYNLIQKAIEPYNTYFINLGKELLNSFANQ